MAEMSDRQLLEGIRLKTLSILDSMGFPGQEDHLVIISPNVHNLNDCLGYSATPFERNADGTWNRDNMMLGVIRDHVGNKFIRIYGTFQNSDEVVFEFPRQLEDTADGANCTIETVGLQFALAIAEFQFSDADICLPRWAIGAFIQHWED